MRYVFLALLTLAAWRLLRRRPADDWNDGRFRAWERPLAEQMRAYERDPEGYMARLRADPVRMAAATRRPVVPWEEPEDGYMVVVQGT